MAAAEAYVQASCVDGFGDRLDNVVRIDLLVATCHLAWVDPSFGHCCGPFRSLVLGNGLVEQTIIEGRRLDGGAVCSGNCSFMGGSRTFSRLDLYGVSMVAAIGEPMEPTDYAAKRDLPRGLGSVV